MGETVTGKGVPVQLSGTSYENDYWASIVLIRSMREGDEKMPVADLVKIPLQEIARDRLTWMEIM